MSELESRLARLEAFVSILQEDNAAFQAPISKDLAALTSSVQTLAETVRLTHCDHERRLNRLEVDGKKLMWAVMGLAGAGGASGSAIMSLLGG